MSIQKAPRARKNRAEAFAADPIWSERLRYFEARQEQIVQTIREFVEIESPSDNKPAADRMGAFLAGDRKSTRLNSSHRALSRMPSSA